MRPITTQIDLPVDHVGNTVEQNGIRECDPGIVDPSRTIGQDGKGEVCALERLYSNVSERRREDHVVGNDVVRKDRLQGCYICGRKHRTDVRKSFVGGYEDSVVGEVGALLISSSQIKVDAHLGDLQGGVQGCVAPTIGEELERSSEGEDCINFVNCDTFTEFNILF